jgi:DNA polymerase III epsilon subunit-like protein
MRMLHWEGIYSTRTICTLKLARYLDRNGVIPKYNLQYLRYFLGLEVDAKAHDALGDILVLEGLFNRLNAKFQENGELKDSAHEMINISNNPLCFHGCPSANIKGRCSAKCHVTTLSGCLGRSWTRIWRIRLISIWGGKVK